MGIKFFILVVAVTAILSEDLKRRDQLPLGGIWIVSSLIYGGLGIVLGLRALWQQPIPNPIALAADQLTFDVLSLALLGFAAGYCVIKRILAVAHTGEMRIAVLIRQASGFSFYSLLVQLLVAGYLLASILLDLPDRYNSYPGSTIIGKILNSISFATLLGPASFFCLGWQVRACTSWPKSRMAVLTGSAAVLNLMLVLKTGSRSILLGLLLAFLVGWLTHSASWRVFVQAVAAVALLLLIFVPFSEALRIARSDSDFYRANPVHAAALLQASMLRKPKLNVILKQLERHPFDRSIYKIVIDCQDRLSRTARGAATAPQAVQLSLRNGDACDADRRGHIATDYWPSFHSILAGLERADFSLLFPSQHYLKSLEINLYGATDLSSKGEAPSLRADVYYRFGFVGVFLVYLCLALLYGAFNSACFHLLCHTSVYAQLGVALLPLTLLTGNLGLGLLAQLWLFVVQLPKNICIVFAVGCAFSLLVRKLKPVVNSFDS
jgi:hypothetical protein